MSKMKLKFGSRNPHTVTLPYNVGMSLKIEINYLAALARNTANSSTDMELNVRIGFVLGQLDIMEEVGILPTEIYTSLVDEVYRVYHGEGNYTFEKEEE